MRRMVSFVYGIMLGGLIGITVGLLLAPATGEELRGQMMERAQQVQLDVKNAAAARRAELEQQLATLRAPKP
jgi:gas vesicle protein